MTSTASQLATTMNTDPLQRTRFNTFPGTREELRLRISGDLAKALGEYRRSLAGSLGRPPSLSLTVELLLRQGLQMSIAEGLERMTTRNAGGGQPSKRPQAAPLASGGGR